MTIALDPKLAPPKPQYGCGNCGSKRWWLRWDNVWICGWCHPQSPPDVPEPVAPQPTKEIDPSRLHRSASLEASSATTEPQKKKSGRKVVAPKEFGQGSLFDAPLNGKAAMGGSTVVINDA